jgi:hypothetical protein
MKRLGPPLHPMLVREMQVQCMARRFHSRERVAGIRSRQAAACRIQRVVRGHLHGRKPRSRQMARRERHGRLGLEADVVEVMDDR